MKERFNQFLYLRMLYITAKHFKAHHSVWDLFLTLQAATHAFWCISVKILHEKQRFDDELNLSELYFLSVTMHWFERFSSVLKSHSCKFWHLRIGCWPACMVMVTPLKKKTILKLWYTVNSMPIILYKHSNGDAWLGYTFHDNLSSAFLTFPTKTQLSQQ